MAEVFSHSKLTLFEMCPEAYKIKYIDKTWPDLPRSVELFLGDLVHQSLEWLYHVRKHREIKVDDLIEHYANNWSINVSEDIRIRQGVIDDYFHKGLRFLINYHKSNFPFQEKTLEIEKEIIFPLDEEGLYKIRGFIDRLDKSSDGTLEIHDYKTNKIAKTQAEADKDRQLALYHLGLQHLHGEKIKAKLIWHFLNDNVKVISERTDEDLEKLRKETLELINKIKTNTEWSQCNKPWCDWCAYKKANNLNENQHAQSQNTKQNTFNKNNSLKKYF